MLSAIIACLLYTPGNSTAEKMEANMSQQTAKEFLVYIGTYTGGESKGIYVYRLDMATGALESTGQVTEAKNPTFLALRPGGEHLYAVSEIGNLDGKPTGGVSAYAIDRSTGGLTFLNQQASQGRGPCHVTVDVTGRYVLVANYGSGSVAALPIQEDGWLGEATSAIQHEGSSVNEKRQEGPHAHSINVDAANRYAFVCDLGIDKVMIYRLDLEGGKLLPNDPPFAPIHPGGGPRHFAFHPHGKHAYVINELDSTMTAFVYDASNGSLQQMQTLSTLPGDFTDHSTCAEVQVHPSGKFLYGSNRGHDSIVIYALDEATGKMTLVGHEPTQGRNPRNFALDPTGTFLLAANQDSGNVVVFRIDQETGELTPTGRVANVPKPVCLKMLVPLR